MLLWALSSTTIITIQHIALALIAVAGPLLVAIVQGRRHATLKVELNGKIDAKLEEIEKRADARAAAFEKRVTAALAKKAR